MHAAVQGDASPVLAGVARAILAIASGEGHLDATVLGLSGTGIEAV